MHGLPRFKTDQQNGVEILTFLLLVVSFLLGGASRQHELRLAVVELAALPLIVVAGLTLLKRAPDGRHRLAFFLLACIAALPLIQMIPLPPAVWSGLPGREQVVLALQVLDLSQGWLPISLTPDETWGSFLALLPPAAMFLAVLAASPRTRLRLAVGVVGLAVIGIVLGAAQLASGGERLYPWATTSAGSVTGFFANRNHLATLCLIGIPFATVLGAGRLYRDGSRSNLGPMLAVIFIALSVVALGVIRSRAGVILFGPVLVASLLAAWVATGRGRPKPLLLALGGGAGLAVAAVAAFALAPVLARFDTQASPEGRFENWPIVLDLAGAHLPLGSGMGSFDPMYRSVEPLNRLDPTFFNHAHNDYLETWLEAGWLGAAVLLVFLIWYGRRSWTAWSAGVSTQRNLQRAATIAIAVGLLHSAADYPLRTATLATIFALCCGLLELATRSDAELGPERSGRRRVSGHR